VFHGASARRFRENTRYPVLRDVHNLRKVSLLINCRVNNAPPHGMHTFACARVARTLRSLFRFSQVALYAFLFSPFRAHRATLAPFYGEEKRAVNVQRIKISHVISHFRGKKLYLGLTLTSLRREPLPF